MSLAVKQFVRSAAWFVDGAVSAAFLALVKDRPGLISFMFHGLYTRREEPFNDNLLPHQPFTVADLGALITHFTELGYSFVSPDQVAAGLDPKGRHVLITFDDGYANNLRALPVLQEHDVPATFFVSTGCVASEKSFWWDAHYRARRRAGADHDTIVDEQEALKRRPFHEIEKQLTDEFGADVFTPVDDTDRPMTEAELKAFAADPRVTIGNHTVDHAILTACDIADAAAQMQACQDYLGSVIGERPIIIAYPNGNYNDAVVEAARAAGLTLGVTVEPHKTRPPFDGMDPMRIGRYGIDGGPTLIGQCRGCRSEIQLLNTYRRLRQAA